MSETVKIPIENYAMKMRLYPSKSQKEEIDRILRALQVAYNMTFYEVFQKNPAVCTAPNKDGDVWPDFKKIAAAAWRRRLKEMNPIVDAAPSASIMTNIGIFHVDGKRAWTTGMHNCPVSEQSRKDFRFYNARNPRQGIPIQLRTAKLIPSEENAKVAWVTLPKVKEKIKVRGFSRKLWFGDQGAHSYAEAQKLNELAEKVTACISKDSCGDYFLSVIFSAGKEKGRKLYLEKPVPPDERPPVGLDMGIKDLAILSNGEKIENPQFKKEKDRALRKLNKKLSARWGPANEAFHGYNHQIREENKKLPKEQRTPASPPSKRYLAAKNTKAHIERKIMRRRDTYYHQQTARLVRQHEMIAVETLYVKNMMRNHKLAAALSDAAMSDFLSKLKYKAAQRHTQIMPIGSFEPSSQRCSACGFLNSDVKNLHVRRWVCPQCGASHDRDVNAAKNILAIALKNGPAPDKEAKGQVSKPRSGTVRRRRGEHPVSERFPDIVVVWSKELTKARDSRYIVINRKTGAVVDDANGVGFRSATNAKNCYIAKKKWTERKSSSQI